MDRKQTDSRRRRMFAAMIALLWIPVVAFALPVAVISAVLAALRAVLVTLFRSPRELAAALTTAWRDLGVALLTAGWTLYALSRMLFGAVRSVGRELWRMIPVLAAVALVSCSPCRHITASQRDSVRVVTAVSTVERFVPDTVWIEIPAQTARERVRDTVSRLENDFARSEARIYADGTLGHILCAKAGRRPAPVLRRDVMTVRTDTVCINRVRRDVVEVARPLTWWQRLQMRGFWLLLALVAGWGWWRLR